MQSKFHSTTGRTGGYIALILSALKLRLTIKVKLKPIHIKHQKCVAKPSV